MDDDLIRLLNRVIQNLEFVHAPIESVVRFIGMAAKEEGIELDWNAEQKKFRRAE